MKDLFKKICFVLLILSFPVFFSFVGKSEVSALVTECTSKTVGQDCEMDDGSEGICKVSSTTGMSPTFEYSCEEKEGEPEPEPDPSQCTSENVGDDCVMGDGSEGVCEFYSKPGNPPTPGYRCVEKELADLPACTAEREDKPCRINYDTIGVCKYRLAPGSPPEYKWVCVEEPDSEEDDWEADPRNWGDKMDAPEPPTFAGNVSGIVDKVLDYLFPIAGVIALIFIIMGGYMWIISAGDPGKVKQAQGTLTWAIFGLIIVMVIFGILRILINFLS